MKPRNNYSILLPLLLTTTVSAADSWNFEDANIGELPAGWVAARTGEGPGSVWKIIDDTSAPAGHRVLAQTSPDGPNPLFNLCLCTTAKYTDLDLKISLKPREGKLDQGGGPVWRCQDKDNYYVARVNPLENDFRLFHVIKGKRTLLTKPIQVQDPAGQWHTIRITHVGSHITCYLNDKKLIEHDDETLRDEGMIGLWTKADAVTSFDNITVTIPK